MLMTAVTDLENLPRVGGTWAGGVCGVGDTDYCLWLDTEKGMRVFETCHRGEGRKALAASLMRAVSSPDPGHAKGRPASVLVSSRADARLVEPVARKLGIRVGVDSGMGRLLAMVAPMLEKMQEESGFGYLDIEGVDERMVRRLFLASTRFAEKAPWNWSNDSSLVRLEGLYHVPIFVSILGAGMEVYGVGIYLSEESAIRVVSSGGPEAIRQNPVLLVDLVAIEEVPPQSVDQARERGWSMEGGYPILKRTDRPVDGMAPTAEEFTLATYVLEIVADMPFHLGRAVSGTASGASGEEVITTWPVQVTRAVVSSKRRRSRR